MPSHSSRRAREKDLEAFSPYIFILSRHVRRIKQDSRHQHSFLLRRMGKSATLSGNSLPAPAMDTTIRLATEADLDVFEKLCQAHFLDEKENGAYTVFQEGIYPARDDAQMALLHNSLYECLSDDIPAGFLIFDTCQPREYGNIRWSCPLPRGKVAVIHLLIVHPHARGRGAGRAMVAFAVNEAQRRGCRAVRLDTGLQNIPACSLYRKMGFAIVSVASMKVGGRLHHPGHLFLEKCL